MDVRPSGAGRLAQRAPRQLYGPGMPLGVWTARPGITAGPEGRRLIMRPIGVRSECVWPHATVSDRESVDPGAGPAVGHRRHRASHREGKLHCAVVLHNFARRVVGWSNDSTQTPALATSRSGHGHPQLGHLLTQSPFQHSPGHPGQQAVQAEQLDPACLSPGQQLISQLRAGHRRHARFPVISVTGHRWNVRNRVSFREPPSCGSSSGQVTCTAGRTRPRPATPCHKITAYGWSTSRAGMPMVSGWYEAAPMVR